MWEILDFIGDMRNDLDGFAQIIAAALLADDVVVDAAGSDRVLARQVRAHEALVMAKIEIGLAKGKKQYDKRQTDKQRDWDREKPRLLREKG